MSEHVKYSPEYRKTMQVEYARNPLALLEELNQHPNVNPYTGKKLSSQAKRGFQRDILRFSFGLNLDDFYRVISACKEKESI